MIKKLFLLQALLVTLLHLQAQTPNNCYFYDDFSNPTLWTHPTLSPNLQNAANYSTLDIVSGKFKFLQSRDNNFNYMFRTGIPITGLTIKADLDFLYTSNGIFAGGAGHVIFSLNDDTQPFYNSLSSIGGIPLSTTLLNCTPSIHNGIAVVFESDLTLAPSMMRFKVVENVGGTSTTISSYINVGPPPPSGSTPFFLRLKKNGGVGELQIFATAARTGIPLYTTGSFPISAAITNLTTVAIGTIENIDADRMLTGALDNLCIDTSSCSLSPTTSGSGCGTAACPWVATSTPAGGTYSAPLNPITGVYIGPIPVGGINYTYTVTGSGCVATVSGVVMKPNTTTIPVPTLTSYTGPSALGPQLVVTFPCTGTTNPACEYYNFNFLTSSGGVVPASCPASSITTSSAPSATFPWPYTPLPAGTCGKIISCSGLVLGNPYKVRMQVVQCGIPGNWSAWLNTAAQRPSGSVSFEAEADAIQVFPNPIGSELHINLQQTERASAVAQLYDLSGRVIAQQQAEVVTGENVLTMNTQSMAEGMYILKVFCDGVLLHTERITK